ncbi:HAAS signaling domain-containing protein [Paenibacillus sp. 1001270B_150601_E10]|uniref:HAAS signaling domain-containing protein n=1 Tax=Paenibacillus sp. 1001270B_150601_E10 TaxID=2787079 RepID=UPI001E35A601|nr:DUF1700 domain-containing protein [Paenibacillus sp. 1001270B_150601_E10]
MHKELFLLKLEAALLPLSEKERMEIVEEYDAHFEFSKQQGRSEEEIAKELGVPEELAAEIIQDQRERKPETLTDIPPFQVEAPVEHGTAPSFQKEDKESSLPPRKSAPIPISEYMRVPSREPRQEPKDETIAEPEDLPSSPPSDEPLPEAMYGEAFRQGRMDAPTSFYGSSGQHPSANGSPREHPSAYGMPGKHPSPYGAQDPNASAYGFQGQDPAAQQQKPIKKKRSAGGAIGVFFVSLVMVPLLIAFWGVFLSLGAVALILILSPALLVTKLYMGGTFHGIDLSAVLIMFGVGIFLIQLVWPLIKGYSKLSGGYMRWVFNIRKERAA